MQGTWMNCQSMELCTFASRRDIAKYRVGEVGAGEYTEGHQIALVISMYGFLTPLTKKK